MRKNLRAVTGEYITNKEIYIEMQKKDILGSETAEQMKPLLNTL